jgi:hypothetical protein
MWNGILKIIEVKHLDVNGSVLWEDNNIYNLMHQDGEEYILRAVFTGGRVSTIIPDSYYLGLDNRSLVEVDNTIDDLIGEPGSNGYERQEVNSSGDFAINFEADHFIATSPIVAFRATVGSWGPVSNLFLSDKSDNSGFLVSTATLGTAITVSVGESVTMRIGMTLRNCPDGT